MFKSHLSSPSSNATSLLPHFEVLSFIPGYPIYISLNIRFCLWWLNEWHAYNWHLHFFVDPMEKCSISQTAVIFKIYFFQLQFTFNFTLY